MRLRAKNAATLIILFVSILSALALTGPRTAAAAPPTQARRALPPVEYRASGLDTPLNQRAPLRLVGADVATTSMVVNFLVAGAPNAFGDTCQTWPAAAKTAFIGATDIWAASIVSSVPIKTNACWASNLGPGILGHSGATDYEINTAGAPPDTYYPAGLANALAHSDLNDHDEYDWDNDGFDADSEFDIAISSSFPWYTGTDGIVPANQVDLESVVLHETGHGLGMLGWMRYANGQGSWGGGYGYPTIYDRFTENGIGSSLINLVQFANPSGLLGAQLVSNDLYFNGVNAKAANGGLRPKLYAPSTWSAGSSYSHLDEIYNGGPNTLMTYSLDYRESIHSPGPILMGILQDLGWTLPAAPVQCYSLTVNASPSNGGTVNVAPASNCSEGAYSKGTVVTLTAHPNSGYYFFGWIGNAGTGASTQVTVNENENITAIFDTYSGPVPSTGFLPLLQR